MAKKFNPFVLLTMPEPSPTTVVGGGTGQSTTDPYACDFTDWMNLFAQDYNDNGIDNDDYIHWFYVTFGDEAGELWEFVNGSTLPADPLNPNVEPFIEPIIEPDPGIEP